MTEELVLDDLLIAHAAGKLDEPVALLVATHLSLSPVSRGRYERYEAVGGAMLDELPPAEMGVRSLAATLGRLERGAAGSETGTASREGAPRRFPAPLCEYLPDNLEQLRWRGYGGASEVDILPDVAGYRTRLIRVRAGRAVPCHTHEGQELTLVLEGAYRDASGRYARGDIEIADQSTDHQPIAEEGQDCICLAVTDAPLRLTGPIGRLLNPFVRI